MLLGKRPRPPMKRTTSMTEFTLDISSITEPQQQQTSDPQNNNPFKDPQKPVGLGGGGGGGGGGGPQRQSGGVYDGLDHRFLSTVSPRNHRRNSAEFLETAHFLRSCSLCKRRLVPGRDIYMYRGDSAFCSLECRQQQMNQDERKDKCSLASKKEASSSTASSKVSTKGETVAAV